METDIKRVVFDALRRVAPEIEPTTIRANERLREQVDIDSMDFLNFIIDLDRELKVDVPESDYGKLATIDDIVAYLSARVRARQGA